MRSLPLFVLAVVAGSVGAGCFAPGADPQEAPVSTVEETDPTASEPARAEPAAETPIAVGLESVPAVALPAALLPLETDFCDDATYPTAKYTTRAFGNLTFQFIEGTAAATDIETIAAVRLAKQTEISTFLGLTSNAPITITMSPNRVAAAAHGFGAGWADAGANRIDVLYLGQADSYERVAPGHELTHVLAARVDGVATHLPVLEEGLAELFDGSGRDMHASYVNELRAGSDAGSVTRFTDWDVWGEHYGRAGSFVKLLVDRFGREKFIDFWRAGAISYSGSGYVTKLGDRVTTGADLEKAIDHASRTVYGLSFEAIRIEWQTRLSSVLEGPTPSLSAEDRAQIDNLVAHLDDAIARGDAASMRATMDGFYCDRKGDDERARIARAAVEARGTMKTTVINAVPTGTSNYPTAIVHAVRRETRAGAESVNAVRYWVERFPIGWRITSATSW